MGICVYYGYNVKDTFTDLNSKNLDVKTMNTNKNKESMVYICTGETSTKYHCDPDCKGLSHCSGEIEEMSKGEAEDMGRTPCKICY